MSKTQRKSIADLLAEDEERKKLAAATRNMPFRFFQGKGEQCEIIILDESLDTFARFEHNMRFPNGKFGRVEACVQDKGKCPYCADGSYASLVFYLSVLVLKPYEIKSGDKKGEVIPFSRMMLAYKKPQLEGLQRIEKIAKKRYGTLRGTCILLKRGSDANSASIGEPIADEDGNLILDHFNENDLRAEYGNDERKSKDGVVYLRKDEMVEPFDYLALFPEPDLEEVEANYRPAPTDEEVAVPATTTRSRQRTTEAEVPGRRRREVPEPAPTPAPPAGRRRAPSIVEDNDDSVDEGEVEEEDDGWVEPPANPAPAGRRRRTA